MATLVLTLRGAGEQEVPPFILFKGEGYLAPDLLAQLDAEGIPYAFNQKAWANEDSCVQHLLFFNDIVKTRPEFAEHMLLLDGLSSQATVRY